jgi:SAM-dependent methyltransferase
VDLNELQRNWHEFGRRNPFGAIVSLDLPEGDLPDWDAAEFFQTGVLAIDAVVGYLRSLPLELRWGRALDFGCGVGRLTQALGRHFRECVGVDIAPSMIELANRYNALGDRCTYRLNTASDLSLFPDDHFDLVYSTIVLQHIAPEYSAKYIREFIRVLAPGGVALFDLPSEPGDPLLSAPPTSFRAGLRLVDAPRRFTAGAPRTLRVRVRNEGSISWPFTARTEEELGRIRLGNHWLDRRGDMSVRDDGRAELPRTVGPDDDVELSLTVHAPARPGVYILELDMVLEGVLWFAEGGSITRKLAALVAPGLRRAATPRTPREPPAVAEPPPEGDAPTMEMHCIKREDVVGIVEASGGRVVDIAESTAAGTGWIGFRYCVTK